MTHMLVASGTSVPAETAAMPAIPGVGSSRYSTTPASRSATLIEVSTVHAPLGSSRSGRSGEGVAQRLDGGALLVGGSTPPLSLSEPKPQPSTIRWAWATSWSGVERLAPGVVGRRRGGRPTCRRGSR